MNDAVLIAPKPLIEFTPSEWSNYVVHFRRQFWAAYDKKKKATRARNAKPPAKDYSFRTNDKGTPIITIRNRKPRYLTKEEVAELAKENNIRLTTMWNLVSSKGIPIKDAPSD